MKAIPLTQGKATVVDDEDFAALSVYKWYFVSRTAGRYVNGGRQVVYMARELLNATPGTEVDHINLDPLDNRRCNIRLCTHEENCRNRKSNGNRCGLKGVKMVSKKGKTFFYAEIRAGDKRFFLGSFKTAPEAKSAYHAAALKYHGEFARL